MILQEFAHRLHTAVAQVVNFFGLNFAVVDLNETAHNGEDILVREHAPIEGNIHPKGIVDFVATNTPQVVAAFVKEERFNVRYRVFDRGGVARAHFLVEFHQRLFGVVRGVAFQCGLQILVVGVVVHIAQQRPQFFIGPFGEQRRVVGAIGHERQRTQENRGGNLALAVNFHANHIALAGFKFQPRPTVGNHLRRRQFAPAGAFFFQREVNVWRANQLADDNALCAVEDKRAFRRHHGEFPHVDILLLNLARFLIDQAHVHPHGRRIGQIHDAAFFFAVFGVFKAIVAKFEGERAVVRVNGRDFIKEFPQAFFQEPLVTLLLNLDEVGKGQNFGNRGVLFLFHRHLGTHSFWC